MNLGYLIKELKKHDPNKKIKVGFGSAHSYRGSYDELAFSLDKNTTVGEMLKEAEAALGGTFYGYKGGDYKMEEYTTCWIAVYGECHRSDLLGPLMISAILNNGINPEEIQEG